MNKNNKIRLVKFFNQHRNLIIGGVVVLIAVASIGWFWSSQDVEDGLDGTRYAIHGFIGIPVSMTDNVVTVVGTFDGPDLPEQLKNVDSVKIIIDEGTKLDSYVESEAIPEVKAGTLTELGNLINNLADEPDTAIEIFAGLYYPIGLDLAAANNNHLLANLFLYRVLRP